MRQIPLYFIKKYAKNELTESEAKIWQNKIESDKAIMLKVSELKQQSSTFFKKNPPDTFFFEFNERLQNDKRIFSVKELKKNIFIGIPLASLFCLFIFFIPSVYQPAIKINEQEKKPESFQSVLFKGGSPEIRLHTRKNGKNVQIKGTEIFSEGDVVHISYLAVGYKYGIIISIDGNGLVTTHFPIRSLSGGGASQVLSQAGEIPLKNAYRLDNAPKFERFYFFAFNKLVDDKQIKQLIKKIKDLPNSMDEPPAAFFNLKEDGVMMSKIIYKK